MKSAARGRLAPARRWLLRAASLLVAPALALGLVEAGLRVAGYGHPTAFWIPTDAPGQLQSNARFGWRFFPPTMSQFPLPLVVAHPRPPERIRIVVFGASAANGWPTPLLGFSRLLEAMLLERFPEAEFEVLNTAVTAINSHVVLPIVRDSAVLSADLYIVYLGHNEVVGPFGAGTVIRGYQPSLALVRASLAARSTRLGQLLEAFADALSRREEAMRVWRGMEMFVEHEVAEHDPRLDVLQDHLRTNLLDIVEEAERLQTPMLLTLPLVNLRSLPPFASGVGQGVARAAHLEARADELRARGLASEGREDEALRLLEQATRLDAGHARTHFALARALLAAEELERARHHFERARDLDRLRFRADSRTLATIATVARETGVPLVDVAARARSAHSSGIVGEELLLEHVHPTFEGHYAIARALFGPVVERLTEAGRLPRSKGMPSAPSITACAERLGLTREWIDRAGRGALETVAARPPFTPEWRTEALEHWQARPSSLPASTEADATIVALRRALARRPEDLLLREALAAALDWSGRADEATRQLQAIVDRYPDWAWVRSRLARHRLAAGAPMRAEQDARAALRVHPGDLEAWSVLAQALAAQDRLEPAIEAAETTIRLAPERAASHFQVARLLLRGRRLDEAEIALRATIERSPDHALALQQLARLRARRGESTEAFALATRAARSAPHSIEILLDVTRFALNAGRIEAARQSWRRATELDPGVALRMPRLAAGVSGPPARTDDAADPERLPQDRRRSPSDRPDAILEDQHPVD